MKNLILSICGLLFVTSCRQKNEQFDRKTIQNKHNLKVAKIQLADSFILLKHLDSLPKINFPFTSKFNNRKSSKIIDFHEFKCKKLFKLPFKLIEREIGGGLIDFNKDDSTFSLVSNTYKAQWNLISKTPKFLILEVYSEYVFLVTMTYDLKVIDAIRSGYVQGNSHWYADRHAVIYKDLTIKLKHYYETQDDDVKNQESYETEEMWFIDRYGNFKQK
jgi:hypothetical protein